MLLKEGRVCWENVEEDSRILKKFMVMTLNSVGSFNAAKKIIQIGLSSYSGHSMLIKVRPDLSGYDFIEPLSTQLPYLDTTMQEIEEGIPVIEAIIKVAEFALAEDVDVVYTYGQKDIDLLCMNLGRGYALNYKGLPCCIKKIMTNEGESSVVTTFFNSYPKCFNHDAFYAESKYGWEYSYFQDITKLITPNISISLDILFSVLLGRSLINYSNAEEVSKSLVNIINILYVRQESSMNCNEKTLLLECLYYMSKEVNSLVPLDMIKLTSKNLEYLSVIELSDLLKNYSSVYKGMMGVFSANLL